MHRGGRHASVTSDDEVSPGVESSAAKASSSHTPDGKGKQRQAVHLPAKAVSLDDAPSSGSPVRRSSTQAQIVSTPASTSDSENVDAAAQRQSKPKTIRATMTRRTSSKLAGLEDSGDDTARPTPRERDSASSAFSRISTDHLQPNSYAAQNRRGSLDPASNAASSSSGGDVGDSLVQHASMASGSPNTLPDAIRESTNRLAAMGSFSSNELVEELRKRQGKANEAKHLEPDLDFSDKQDLSPSPTNRPSELSRMLSRSQPRNALSVSAVAQGVSPPEDNDQTPRAPALSLATSYSTSSGTLHGMRKKNAMFTSVESSPSSSLPPTVPQSPVMPLAPPTPLPQKAVDERTPLIGRASEGSSLEEGKISRPVGVSSSEGGKWARIKGSVDDAISRTRKATWQDVVRGVIVAPAQNVPAVILGSLLNVLDGVSYGMIL